MKKIAILGSINMDMTAETDRIPKKGETVSAHALHYVPGGKGANQAVAAARLGADVTMFGCVGDGSFGPILIDNLRKNGVNTSCIDAIPGESSGLAMIIVAEKDNVITVIPGANARVDIAYVDAHWESLKEADIILLQNEIPMETVVYAAQKLHALGKTVIYNPAPIRIMPEEMMQYVDFMTPNEHEAAWLSEHAEPDNILNMSPDKVITTMGSRGVSCQIDGETLFIPAFQAEVVDTTGAGDTFNGTLAYGLAEGMSLQEALSFANAAASLSIEKAGAQGGMPTVDAVLERLKRGSRQ